MGKYLDKNGLTCLCAKLKEYIAQQIILAQEGKQDIIQDLDSIREGALSAYQKPDDGISKTDLSEDIQERILQDLTDQEIEGWFISNE